MSTVPMPLVAAMLLRTVAVVAKDPGLGYRGEALSRILEIGAALVEQGDGAVDALNALNSEIASMVEDGRNPGKAEWLALKERSEKADAVFRGYLASGEPAGSGTDA